MSPWRGGDDAKEKGRKGGGGEEEGAEGRERRLSEAVCLLFVACLFVWLVGCLFTFL
jgi:hypothetical protein